MFEVDQHMMAGHVVVDKHFNTYLHSDGSHIVGCPECWPTREQAQAVLDKYRPPYVWKHGDVFTSGRYTQIFLEPGSGPMTCVLDKAGKFGTPDSQLPGAIFLFNIKDKLGNS